MKKPKHRFEPSSNKTPKVANEPEQWLKRFPAWRVGQIEMIEPWGWHVVSAATIREIHKKLADFESMTWKEILLDAKKQNHSVRPHQICKEARVRLGDFGYGDAERLFSLRLSGSERVRGIMNERVLTVLWWDPEHTV